MDFKVSVLKNPAYSTIDIPPPLKLKNYLSIDISANTQFLEDHIQKLLGPALGPLEFLIDWTPFLDAVIKKWKIR